MKTTRKDRTAIKLLVIATAAVLVVAPGANADVNALYEKNCVKCHGADGKGDTKMGQKAGVKDLTDAKVQEGFDDAKAFKSLKEGLKDGDKVKKKPAEGLSDDDIKALVTYVRTFKK